MKIFKLLSLIAFLTISPALMAQAPPPPGSGNNAPLGGIALLAAAGAAYGGKKAYDRRQSE